MSFNTRALAALTTVLALSVTACSATSARGAHASEPPRQCAGGVIQNADDAARFAGCTTVEGELRIENSNLSDLADLNSLRNVSGALTIAHNSELTDLGGLQGLTSVGSLELIDNPELGCLRGLSALRHAQAVEIRSNPELTSLHGLEGLQSLEKLALVDDGLFETAGLSHLHEVGELTIASNARLISLRGLNGLTRAGSVQIRNNHVLCARLGLLPRLSEVGEALVLSSNRSVSRRELQALRDHVKQVPMQPAVASRELALH